MEEEERIALSLTFGLLIASLGWRPNSQHPIIFIRIPANCTLQQWSSDLLPELGPNSLGRRGREEQIIISEAFFNTLPLSAFDVEGVAPKWR